MKIIKIKRLTLRNFKGIKGFTLEPQGESVSIFGDNGTGKTTIFDSFCWLLFDKDSQGKATFEVKSLSQNGEALHGLEHEVEAVLEVEGRDVTLRKVLTEKWTKKRGSAQQEFTGHTTAYYIDEIPVQLKDYKDAVARIADENLFKLLTSPTYFNEQLHWQARRETLLDVCGNIGDEDVIASDPSLKDLPAILKGRKLEDHRKAVDDRRKKVNEELKTIPVRIDEITRSMPDTFGIDREHEKSRLGLIETQIKTESERLLQLQSGGAVAEKHVEVSRIEADMLRIQTTHRRNVQANIDKMESAKRGIKNRFHAIDDEISGVNKGIDLYQATIDKNAVEMNRLREEFRKIAAVNFEYKQDSVCPTCGQAIPEDQLNAARERALTAFNLDRSGKLARIDETGKGLALSVKEKQGSIVRDKGRVDALHQSRPSIEKEIEDVDKMLLDLQDSLNFQCSPEYAALEIRMEDVTREIKLIQGGQQADIEPIKKAVSSLEREKEDIRAKINRINQSKSFQERIEQLKAQERTLAAEYENLEGELYLTEQFVKSKVSLLESRINGKFELARFKLFAEQINGGLSEVCDTTFQGVPYSTGLNHGAQINVGLDIIKTLSGHYGLSLPIFVDNSEAVTRLLPVDSQVIKLIVSEQDKQLRIEKE